MSGHATICPSVRPTLAGKTVYYWLVGGHRCKGSRPIGRGPF